MRSKKTRIPQIGIALIIVANGLAFVGAILLKDIWMIWIMSGVIAFELYLFYTQYNRRKKLQYPLVPPEGRGDIYLPRTNIPRPIHEDFRRIQGKKTKFAQIDRWRRKKKGKVSQK